MSDSKLSFEASLGELEKTVKALESGELSLADSIELYEKGIRLSKECAKALEGARQRIITLSDAESEEGNDA